jgi:hypothetical protein
MARALQTGPVNMTDRFKFKRGSQQTKREVKKNKAGRQYVNSVLTIEHKIVIHQI